jgi:hypothetical protein
VTGFLSVEPDVAPRRTDRKICPTCEASAAGCRSLHWLAGRYCCESCTGDHDVPTTDSPARPGRDH